MCKERDRADRGEYEQLKERFEEEDDDYGYTTAVDAEYDWPLRRKPFTGAGPNDEEDILPPLSDLNIADNVGGMDMQQPPIQTHTTTPPPIIPPSERQAPKI
ncbi:hypothetical protein WOLCODRAFT_158070 [Wolfiporia cocos MD-104 SS10]|uniref:Uncharacterized protein n=1 Tax=Wolfiporia cocos (strain MD-104) TaxID=742152 RepID=A0A2H3J5W4_WOLCO|nr:hypothetical protein WOLCODRAFT_158070 [Wolfiporia cocos MD-104 SS10]